MSVLEISHRSKTFEAIIQQAEADVRELAGIPANYHVLFLQGGASLQFSMVPMNLLGPGQTADYIVTGAWGQKAVKEAKRVGTVNVAATTETGNFTRLPAPGKSRSRPARPTCTSRRTRPSTAWSGRPTRCSATPARVRHLVEHVQQARRRVEVRVDLRRRPEEPGPSGVTLVVLRDDLLARSPQGLGTMLNYNTHAKEKSLYNTPPTFGVYLLGS